jgi:DNA-binding MarR family transcriptional regulator
VSSTTAAARTTATDDVGFLLAKASQRFNELLLERFVEAGFPEVRASFGSVLVPLFGADELRLGEIAQAARLSKQAMTTLVQQCERAGLVERERDPQDGRAFRVRLTPRGRKFQRTAERVLADLDARIAAALGTRKRDALIEALKGVIDL